MAWVKIDDGLYRHEKRWELDLDGIGLFVLMLCYANDKLTDGFVPRRFVEANVPRPDRRGTVRSLLKAGMIEQADEGYLIRDYLDFQPSREQVLQRRAARAEAGRKGGRAKHAAKQMLEPLLSTDPAPSTRGSRDEASSQDENEKSVATPTEFGAEIVDIEEARKAG